MRTRKKLFARSYAGSFEQYVQPSGKCSIFEYHGDAGRLFGRPYIMAVISQLSKKPN